MTTERSAWVVTVWYPDDGSEVAAVFADRADALGYAAWWNRAEVHRYGSRPRASAEVAETDFYPCGAWRPPAGPRSVGDIAARKAAPTATDQPTR